MNTLSRSQIRQSVRNSMSTQSLSLGLLALCGSLVLFGIEPISAQPSAPDQVAPSSAGPQGSETAKPAPAAPTQAATPQVQQTSVAQKTQGDKDEFERVKEARLNELRYKHLWIAYSLVWLIIFVFIRGTWRRSQAVEQRIIELQNRLSKLE